MIDNELEYIEVFGAREHNLKEVDLRIPRNKLVVITGISGSGKSSLAFDTIYAEGQRRYMETFSAYARQFIGEMERPDVEQIRGLSPVISIEQKTTSRNPRSTVGTVTDIYDFLRLLFARVGEAHSYITGKKMVRYTEDQMMSQLFERFHSQQVAILAPLVRGRKGHYRELFEHTRRQGYTKVRVDGKIQDIVRDMQLERYETHDIEVVIDRLRIEDDRRERVYKSLQTALKMGNGLVYILDYDNNSIVQYSKHLMCLDSGISYDEPSPNTFSFNSPYGACPHCKGLGVLTEVDLSKVIPNPEKSINDVGIVPLGEVRDNGLFKQLRALSKKHQFSFSTAVKDIPKKALDIILYGSTGTGTATSAATDPSSNATTTSSDMFYNLEGEGIVNMLKRWYDQSSSDKVREWVEEFMSVQPCPECGGSRLKKEAQFFKIDNTNISELSEMDIRALHGWITDVETRLSDRQQAIGRDILKELRYRLGFLLDVGLDYLSMNRPAASLSGGEAQRIRLATQIGSQLTGITYILDEPSIGLHQRDNQKLIEALRELTNIGNTVLVVEHDKDIMLAADYIFDLGPGAGKHGGYVVAEGTPAEFLTKNTLTADYLSNRKMIETPTTRRTGNGLFLSLSGCTGHNLKNVAVQIPLGTFCCVTGVSGSGKSSLINETLYPILRKHFYDSRNTPLPYQSIQGLEHLDKVIEIDQAPIGRTPRSNPVTYINVFTEIRNLFASVPEAKIRGYNPGRFSFNVKGGRCEICEGAGKRLIEMNFLPDVQVNCETCLGRRFNRQTLEILYKGKSISDVLDMSVDDAVNFFENVPKIYNKLRTLRDVGLGYITLGQSAVTLSGGEAQRVKLSEELSKRDTGKTIYILDEPTTGLHFEDIRILLHVLNKLVDKGNTVIIIEHNLDVVRVADYIIDLGKEGGNGGGQILCTGTPEQVATIPDSYTGMFLKKELDSLLTHPVPTTPS